MYDKLCLETHITIDFVETFAVTEGSKIKN